MQLVGGGTNTADAIEFVKTTMFSPASGARSNVPRIAIMVTDGGTSETAAAITQATEARNSNIGILGVGVGGGVNMNELNSIADKPSASHVITVSNYNQLESVSNQLMSMACGGMYDFRQVLF
jgi:predicted alpha/beta-fold hydrolase